MTAYKATIPCRGYLAPDPHSGGIPVGCPELDRRRGMTPDGPLSYPQYWDRECSTCHNTGIESFDDATIPDALISAAVEARIEPLETALRFYAEIGNYRDGHEGTGPGGNNQGDVIESEPPSIFSDEGKTARIALSVEPHRFSGWPGAWCLDCGIADAGEECLADVHRSSEFRRETAGEEREMLGDHVCMNDACPEPNSNAYNPYVKAETDD